MYIAKGCIVTGGTLLKAGFAVICGKIAAMSLGPAEFADYGQYLLAITMLQGVASLGLANAHVIYFTQHAEDDSFCIKKRAAYSLAFIGGVSVAIVVVVVISLPVGWVSYIPTLPLWLTVVLFLYCALTPIVVAKIAEFNALGHLASQQLLAVSTSSVQMCILLLLVYNNAMQPAEAAAAYCAGFIVIGLTLVIATRGFGSSHTGALAEAWQHYGKFVLPSVSVPFIASIATISAFSVIKSHVAPDDAGVWFALWRLAEAYHGIIVAIGATLFLPRLGNAGARIKVVAVKLFCVMLVLYTPWAFVLLCWPEQTISLAFSHEFSTNLPSLLAQVAGDICKILCSTCILVYIGLSRPRVVVAGEVIFGLLFVFLLTVGIQGQGLGRCLKIYALSYAILASLMVFTIAVLLQKRGS